MDSILACSQGQMINNYRQIEMKLFVIGPNYQQKST